jgi:GT2 family glycosyltransferase
MEFCFDSLFIKNDTLHAIGWVVGSAEGNPVKIQVYGSDKKELPCKITRAIRPDVGLAKFGDPKASDVGIFLQIPYPKDGLIRVRFSEIDAATQSIIHSQEVPLSRFQVRLRNFYKENKERIQKPKKVLRDWKRTILHKEKKEYTDWLYVMRAKPAELAAQRDQFFSYHPCISILLSVSEGPVQPLMETILSVLHQTYGNLELCLVNCSPDATAFSDTLTRWAASDSRIHLKTASAPMNPIAGLNEALAAASGDYVAILKQNDMLEEEALYDYVRQLNKKVRADVLYCDEDQFTKRFKPYFNPHFKSNFNVDLLYGYNYMRHFLMVSRPLAAALGGWRADLPGSWEYDFILRCTEHTKKIAHLSRVLYHVRVLNTADKECLSFDPAAEVAALNEHYARIGLNAKAACSDIAGCYVSTYTLAKNPLVSVLIPNKDHTDDLDVCLRSLLDGCTYSNLEVIVIENNSTESETFAYYKALSDRYPQVKVITWESGGVFNYSAINNYGFAESHGDYILLLNNDVEVITPNLIESLLGYCMRPEVGIVGARLLFDDDTVQHAGVLVGAGGLADHVFKGDKDDAPGYMNRSLCTQDLSAVTAACLMVKRSVYEEVGGLDETFQVAFNDVDFCLKVRKAGYLVVYDAQAKLHHYESKSRGIENTPEKFVRFGNEMYHMNDKWGILKTFSDPYYNPNLSYLEYYKINHTKKEQRLKKLPPAYRSRILRRVMRFQDKKEDRKNRLH